MHYAFETRKDFGITEERLYKFYNKKTRDLYVQRNASAAAIKANAAKKYKPYWAFGWEIVSKELDAVFFGVRLY